MYNDILTCTYYVGKYYDSAQYMTCTHVHVCAWRVSCQQHVRVHNRTKTFNNCFEKPSFHRATYLPVCVELSLAEAKQATCT